MLRAYLLRGATAGAAGGLAYGAFTGTVGVAAVGALERAAGHGHHATVDPTTLFVNGLAGLGVGLAVGLVVFGLGYYLFEPALPGSARARSGALALVGFLTVAGVPWLALPPLPPGASAAAPTETRVAWYLTFLVFGAVAAGLAVLAYRRVRRRSSRTVGVAAAGATFVPVVALAWVAPAPGASTTASPVLVALYRAVVVFGQATLWGVTALAHARLATRPDRGTHTDSEPRPATG